MGIADVGGDPGAPEFTVDTVRALFVDDDPEYAAAAAEFFGSVDDVSAVVETSARDGLARLDDEEIDVVVSDYEMPGTDGLEFLDRLREDYPDLPFILLTGQGSEAVASEAISAGVTDYVRKGNGTAQYRELGDQLRRAAVGYRARRQLRAQEARFRKLIEGSTDLIAVLDESGTVEYVSPAVTSILGYEPSDLVGTDAFEDVHPEDRESVEELFRAAVEDPSRTPSAELRYRAADGEWRILEATGRNMLDDPDVNGFVVNASDVTDQRRTERQFHEFVEQSPTLLSILEGDGTVTYASPSHRDVLGLGPGELEGLNAFEYVHEDDVEAVLETFATLVERPDAVETVEFRFETDDGWSWLEAWGKNRLDDPFIEGVVVNAQDITERKARQRELRRQNERLEEFASVVSHDMRNPLSVAAGRLQLARDDCESEHLDAMAAAHDRMERLIDDLLTLARQGQLVEETAPVALEAVVADALATVDADTDPDVSVEPVTVVADRERLLQALENLLQNAVRYGHADDRTRSDDGGTRASPVATIRVGPLDDGRGFYVEDDGPGVPPDAREQIFDRGYTTSREGTGFGLSIVRSIVQAHGWAVAVTEGDDGGARFEVTGVELA